MSPWYGIGVFLAALAASIAIRAPHDARSREILVVRDGRGRVEVMLLVLMAVAVLLLPLFYVATPWLSFADREPNAVASAAGIVLVGLWLWLFHRAHADLGTNWSVTLQLRENHHLVTSGIYARIRHPMYAALFAHAGAQALLLANWVAGPAMLLAFVLMFTLRIGPEERMLRERFGEAWDAYARHTKRLIPGVW